MRIALVLPLLSLLSVVIPIPANALKDEHFGFLVESDASMATCVSCHNGQPGKGRDVSRCSSGRMCLIYGMHLVEVKFPPPDKKRKYATLEEAEIRGFKFDNGLIFCRTCHSLTSTKEHLLVIEVQGDKLCLGCHLA